MSIVRGRDHARESRHPSRLDDAELIDVLDQVERLRAWLITYEEEHLSAGAELSASTRASIVNLLHYLALRQRDVRGLQSRLTALGLSSLGRSESHVMASIGAVASLLERAAGRSRAVASGGDAGGHVRAAPLSPGEALNLLEERTGRLLGPRPSGRRVRIMVTMPTEAAVDADLAGHLIASGMDVARINCAHDGPEAWGAMIAHVRRASAERSRPCRILMDLGGPKIRTGPLGPGVRVLKLRPERDESGRVIAPQRIEIVPVGAAPARASTSPQLRVDPGWLARLAREETIAFTDLRGERRRIRIREVAEGRAIAEADRTAYLGPGTVLRAEPRGEETALTEAPEIEKPILLSLGDRLTVRRDAAPAEQRESRAGEMMRRHASIGCTLPEALEGAEPGHRVWLDDGKIGGVIRAVRAEGIEIELTEAPPSREAPAKLRADKGINFPDSPVRLQALTLKDREDLRFVAAHADMVGLSFVQRAADVNQLLDELRGLGAGHVGVVLKIETARAFRNLPELLLAALRAPIAGVMIARGDLGVEVGYQRLAEVQEEILWLCEAAHLPVIWATQVLETLAKSGRPTRAEVTDAAMGERAEAVMLNKGPYIEHAVRMLDDILRRMEAHQFKKAALLRPLGVARDPA